jgi:hypothetical protein
LFRAQLVSAPGATGTVFVNNRKTNVLTSPKK